MERRSYAQFCGLARALDLVGERWTLLIVRNLIAGPQRYGELQAGLPGITTNLLAKRLKEMQEAELLVHADKRYALSARGRELEPAVMALGAWGQQFLFGGPRDDDVVNIRWGMVSLKRRYRGQLQGRVTLVIDTRTFTLAFGPEAVEVTEDVGQPGAPPVAPVVVRGPMRAFQAWIFRGQAPAHLDVTGRGFKRFCSSFGLRAG